MASADRRAVPLDYDDPRRLRTARDVLRRGGLANDVFPLVAERIVAGQHTPVLDVGCGEGPLAGHLPDGVPWHGLDGSPAMLASAPEPKTLGDATVLPFADGSFGACCLLYVLYHLPDPRPALAEAARVLRPGGLVAVSAPSAHDSPELAHVLPRERISFDAEVAPGMLGELFEEVEVIGWDAPMLQLPDRAAVRDYLIGRQVPASEAAARARRVGAPLTVTKRGALVFARRPERVGSER